MGRDALVDAYQEALDLVVYLRQAIEERKGCGHCYTATPSPCPICTGGGREGGAE